MRSNKNSVRIDVKQLRLIWYLLLIAGFLSLSVIVSLTKAQGDPAGQSLEISPPSQELNGNPGETVTVTAKIRNRTTNALPITARIEDFVAQGSEGQVALTEKGPWSVSTWTTLTPTAFDLKPGEQKEVIAKVVIPPQGAGGGRYGAIVFSVAPSSISPTGDAAKVSQEVASLFLLRISGPVIEKMNIESFSTDNFREFGPIPFTLNLKNTGNVHLKSRGVIAITDMFGKKVADVPLDNQNVFPQASRETQAVWSQTLLLGRYTALAIIQTGGTANETLTAQTSFVVFPVRIAGIVILIIIVLYLARKRIAKAFSALAGK